MRSPKIPKQPTPQPTPPPPTIDEAARNAEENDRARRRRGRLANIIARGGGNATVAQKTLTGQ